MVAELCKVAINMKAFDIDCLQATDTQQRPGVSSNSSNHRVAHNHL